MLIFGGERETGVKKIDALRKEQAGLSGISHAAEEERLDSSYTAIDDLHQVLRPDRYVLLLSARGNHLIRLLAGSEEVIA